MWCGECGASDVFADADVFWKWPSVYDAIGVAGVVLSLVSIWLALDLAKKQLRMDLQRVADEAVERVARLVLTTDFGNMIGHLSDANRSIEERDWAYAIIRLRDAAAVLSRHAEHGNLLLDERYRIQSFVVDIRNVIEEIITHSRSTKNRGHLPPKMTTGLHSIVLKLESIRGGLLR
jgi:hypothetical protein